MKTEIQKTLAAQHNRGRRGGFPTRPAYHRPTPRPGDHFTT